MLLITGLFFQINIIQLKARGESNRSVARLWGINRKTPNCQIKS